MRPDVQVHVRAIEALREQLAIANRRIDELLEERRRDAGERRQLMAVLTDRRRRPWVAKVVPVKIEAR